MTADDAADPQEELNQLLLLFQRGDRAAYRRLYVHYADQLVKRASWKFGFSRVQAEDVAQEFFTNKIFRSISSYSPEKTKGSGPRGWFMVIFDHFAIDQLRKARRIVPADDEANLASDESDPEDDLLDKELILDLRMAIEQQLTAKEKVAVTKTGKGTGHGKVYQSALEKLRRALMPTETG